MSRKCTDKGPMSSKGEWMGHKMMSFVLFIKALQCITMIILNMFYFINNVGILANQ